MDVSAYCPGGFALATS
ncbi:BgTH12-00253 [Blumeria graminis f. sp. triticale]|uniref:BgTH12-00253 n=1 Tax=Blumeria graminis f. sp. triticale TaxID=1689686 RepID=A0A9W4DBE6_BLUGR|nr:BgTH12-00253 [Blumeria graminis f. sp. triticale]